MITSERSWGHIFNIGNDISVPIKEVAEYIHKVCKSHSDIAYLTMPPERRGKSEIYRRLPSIEKINSFINWKPKVAWQDSIDQIVAAKIKKSLLVSEI